MKGIRFFAKSSFGLFLLVLVACQPQSADTSASQQASQAPLEVGVMTLRSQSVPVLVSLPGRTVASAVAEIRPQVAGIIEKRVFAEGSMVEKGDLLYQIDPKTYQAELDSANAALAKAKASVPSATALVERYKKLLAAKGVSQQELDDAKATLMQARADVKAAEADVEMARINLQYTRVTAPISGHISTSAVTRGALVTANQETALATIRQIDPIYVDLTESSTNMLVMRRLIEQGSVVLAQHRKHGVTLRLEDGSEYQHEGFISSIDAIVSESTDTVTVRTTLDNPETRLLPGMYVWATIKLGSQPHAYLLPQRAVNRTPKGQAMALFVKTDNTLETRLLSTSRAYANNWVVTEGISSGDQLVLEGGQKAVTGQVVKPLEMRIAEDGLAYPLNTAEQLPGQGNP